MIYFLIALLSNTIEVIGNARKLRADMNRKHRWMAE
jgi:hypothetical protein